MRAEPTPTLLGIVLLGPAIAAALLGANAGAGLQQRPRFEARVNRVRVNVIVTDSEGGFVADLRAEDFLVYEDGELREGIDVQLVDLSAGVVTPLSTALSTGEPVSGRRPVEPGAAPDAPHHDAVAKRFGAVVFFIDFTGLDHITKLHFNERWEKYLETKTAITVPTAVYLIDEAGILTEIAPLTTDIDELRAAQQSVDATPLTRNYFGSALPGIATPPGGPVLLAGLRGAPDVAVEQELPDAAHQLGGVDLRPEDDNPTPEDQPERDDRQDEQRVHRPASALDPLPQSSMEDVSNGTHAVPPE